MRGAQLVSGVMFAAVAWACSGGSGPTSTATTENEPAGTNLGPEPGAKGPESGSTGPEPVNPIGDPTSTGAGSSSGGTSSTGATCSYCNKTYSCGVVGASAAPFTMTLTEQDGVCVAASPLAINDAPGVFSCDGTLTAGTESLSWTADGSGGFSFAAPILNPGATNNLETVNVTCDPS